MLKSMEAGKQFNMQHIETFVILNYNKWIVTWFIMVFFFKEKTVFPIVHVIFTWSDGPLGSLHFSMCSISIMQQVAVCYLEAPGSCAQNPL